MLHGLAWPGIELAYLRFLVLPGFAWPCQAALCPPWPGLDLSGLALLCLGWPCLDWPCIALLCLALVYLHSPYLAWTGLEIFFNPASLGLSCSGVDFLGMSGLALRFLLIP